MAESVISKLQKELYITSKIQDSYRTNINADISYLETVSKVITGLVNAINFRGDQNFLSHQLFKQPSGVSIDAIFNSLNDILTNVNTKALPSMKRHATILQQNKVAFDKNIEKNINALKHIFLIYNDKNSNLVAEKDRANLNMLISHQWGKVNVDINGNFVRCLEELEKVFDEIHKDLNEEDQILKNACKDEDDEMTELVHVMNNGLPYLKSVEEVKREYKEEEFVSYHLFFINDLMTELECCCGIQHFPERESAKAHWLKEDDAVAFFARVWENYEPENKNEIKALKKEMVKVLKTGYSGLWLVEKSDGQKGYLPCSILEPVDE